jgi:hypothetical protein
MPKNEDAIECKERDRLLAKICDAIRQTIRTRGQAEADASLNVWKMARKTLMEHMKKHGC